MSPKNCSLAYDDLVDQETLIAAPVLTVVDRQFLDSETNQHLIQDVIEIRGRITVSF